MAHFTKKRKKAMKKRYFVMFLLLVVAVLLCFAACDNTNRYEGQAKITFELEGGTYNERPFVTHYYDIPEGQKVKIGDLVALSNGKFKRDGYQFEGWYKTKNADGTYSDKWDFDRDTVTAGQEVALYANWEVPVKHTFDVCYLDENNQKVVLYSISARQGGTCSTALIGSYAARTGYTVVDYYDADGNLWDENFAHPGGDEDLAVEIYVKYVKGNYRVVKSASDFGSGNIYIARDIDMGGKKLDLSYFTKGTFDGNGFTISNFEINYTVDRDLTPDIDDDSLRMLSVSIFGQLNEATIRNVTFDNFSVDVSVTHSRLNKVYISPISGSAANTTLSNVHVSNFNFTASKLPNGMSDGDLTIVTDRLVYKIGENVSIDNCTVTQTAESEQ